MSCTLIIHVFFKTANGININDHTNAGKDLIDTKKVSELSPANLQPNCQETLIPDYKYFFIKIRFISVHES